MGDWFVKFKDGKSFSISEKYDLVVLENGVVTINLSDREEGWLNNAIPMGYINLNEVRYILRGSDILKSNAPY